jgi:hypothetical protein
MITSPSGLFIALTPSFRSCVTPGQINFAIALCAIKRVPWFFPKPTQARPLPGVPLQNKPKQQAKAASRERLK